MTSGLSTGVMTYSAPASIAACGRLRVEHAADAGENLVAESAAHIGDDLQRVGRGHGDLDAGDAARRSARGWRR